MTVVPDQPRIARAVGSDDMAELVGRSLMLDILDQMHGQPDRWVLISGLPLERIPVTMTDAIAALDAVAALGWVEGDMTFITKSHRVRLTDQGRALLTMPSAPRMRVHGRRKPGLRRKSKELPTRELRAFAVALDR